MKKASNLDPISEGIKLRNKASRLAKCFHDKHGFVKIGVYVDPYTLEWVIMDYTVPFSTLHGTAADLDAFIKLHSQIVNQHKRARTYIRSNNRRLSVIRNKYNKLKKEVL